jgi:CRISPR-associated protein Cas2
LKAAPGDTAMDEHLYIVTYDISDPKRWRSVFTLMKGYGEWVQLSVFQCRLTRRRHAELLATLDEIIHHGDDHVLMLDIGPADHVVHQVISLGKTFEPVVHEVIVV